MLNLFFYHYLSRCLKLVYIIMFRMSRYALAHSFAHKHRFYWSRSSLRFLFNLPISERDTAPIHINQFKIPTYANSRLSSLRMNSKSG